MSWLDSCIAVPTCGINFAPNFLAHSKRHEILAPILDEIFKENESVGYEHGEMNAFKINEPNGYIQQFELQKIVVTYRYLQQQEKVDGDFSRILSPELSLYPDLLDNAISRLKKAIQCHIDKYDIEANRLGFVVNASLTNESAPPGIHLLIEHFDQLWPKPMIACNVQLTPDIDETDRFNERCHIMLRYDKSQSEEIIVMLDWHRLYKEGYMLKNGKIISIIDECQIKALDYFERIGIGDVIQ